LWDAQSLVDFARSHTGAIVSSDTVLHRVQFRYLGEVDPRPPRPLLNLDEVSRRLERFDGVSSRGPWAVQTLRLIEQNPHIVARDLAHELGWEPTVFKAHVRKLKAVGLTISCEVGYELSELGQSYLDSVAVEN
jgi:Winged helix-turn-helix DNA-binding